MSPPSAARAAAGGFHGRSPAAGVGEASCVTCASIASRELGRAAHRRRAARRRTSSRPTDGPGRAGRGAGACIRCGRWAGGGGTPALCRPLCRHVCRARGGRRGGGPAGRRAHGRRRGGGAQDIHMSGPRPRRLLLLLAVLPHAACAADTRRCRGDVDVPPRVGGALWFSCPEWCAGGLHM